MNKSLFSTYCLVLGAFLFSLNLVSPPSPKLKPVCTNIPFLGDIEDFGGAAIKTSASARRKPQGISDASSVEFFPAGGAGGSRRGSLLSSCGDQMLFPRSRLMGVDLCGEECGALAEELSVAACASDLLTEIVDHVSCAVAQGAVDCASSEAVQVVEGAQDDDDGVTLTDGFLDSALGLDPFNVGVKYGAQKYKKLVARKDSCVSQRDLMLMFCGESDGHISRFGGRVSLLRSKRSILSQSGKISLELLTRQLLFWIGFRAILSERMAESLWRKLYPINYFEMGERDSAGLYHPAAYVRLKQQCVNVIEFYRQKETKRYRSMRLYYEGLSAGLYKARIRDFDAEMALKPKPKSFWRGLSVTGGKLE